MMAAWYTEGEKTGTNNAGTLLADTGALAGGTTPLGFVVSAAVSTKVKVERRNADNTATVKSQVFHVSAAAPVVAIPTVGVAVDANERFRIILDQLTVGSVQASLFSD